MTRLSVFALVAVALAACGQDARRSLGLEKTGPDAFTVVSRAPLELPPEFTLRPPQPGAARPNEATTRDRARQVVFGGPTTGANYNGRPGADAALLRAAGADRAQPDIRAQVDRETSQIARESRTMVDALVFWKDNEPPTSVVDAVGERQRLKDNAAAGKSATDGDTPVIVRKKGGLLEGLF